MKNPEEDKKTPAQVGDIIKAKDGTFGKVLEKKDNKITKNKTNDLGRS